jgi:hypothetical protein
MAQTESHVHGPSANPLEAAAGSNFVPISKGDEVFPFTIEGRPPLAPGQVPSATYYCVTPDYFRVLEIPVSKGLTIDEQDRDGEPHSSMSSLVVEK